MKELNYLLMFLVLVSVVISVTISEFTNELTTENLTFTTYMNITRFLDVPIPSIADNLTITLRGYNQTRIQTTPDFYECVGASNPTCDNVSDNDVDSRGIFQSVQSYQSWYNLSNYYENYTNPQDVRWNIHFDKGYGLTYRNVTPLNTCWNHPLKFKAEVTTAGCGVGSKITFSCNDGASWNVIDSTNCTNIAKYLHEDSLNWSPTPPDLKVHIGNEFLYNKTFLYDSQETQFNSTVIEDNINNCDCLNCSTVNDYCRIPVTFESTAPSILEYSSVEFNYTGVNVDNCTDYTFQILNLSYFDELDNQRLITTNGYDLTFTTENNLFSTDLTGEFSGKSSDKFCSNLNLSQRGINLTVTGTFTLSRDDYGTQIYESTSSNPIYGVNNPPTRKDFYLIRLNESSTVVYTWLTSTYEAIDGTMVIYQCQGDGSKTLVSSNPIIGGESSANIELINTPYSYEVIYNGQTYTDNSDYSKCHVETQTERQFIVDIGTDVSPVIGLYSISCNLTKTGNNTVTMEWGTNPESSSAITGCIFADRISVSGSTTVYTNCTTVSPIIRTIPLSGFSYNVYGKVYQNGYSIMCQDGLEYNVDTQSADTLGMMGIFSVLLFIVGMILLFSNESPMWYPLIGAVGLVSAFFLGFVAFGWVTVTMLLFFVLIIIMVGRYHRKE